MELKCDLDSCWFRNKYFSMSVKSQIDLAHESQIIVKKGQKLKIKFIAKSEDDLSNLSELVKNKNICCSINPEYSIVDDNGYEVKCFSASKVKTI